MTDYYAYFFWLHIRIIKWKFINVFVTFSGCYLFIYIFFSRILVDEKVNGKGVKVCLVRWICLLTLRTTLEIVWRIYSRNCQNDLVKKVKLLIMLEINSAKTKFAICYGSYFSGKTNDQMGVRYCNTDSYLEKAAFVQIVLKFSNLFYFLSQSHPLTY